MARWLTLLGCLALAAVAEEPPNPLQDLDSVAIAAYVEGEEVASPITPEALTREMGEDLKRAGIPIAEAPSGDIPVLTLVFASQVLEPFPTDPEEPSRVHVMSIRLSLQEPMENARHPTPIIVRSWQTHVQAWALEGKVQEIACVAVRKALNRFIEAYRGNG